MESGASRDVEHFFDAEFAQLFYEELAFSLGSTFLVDQFVAFLHERMDIFFLVFARFADRQWVSAIVLLCFLMQHIRPRVSECHRLVSLCCSSGRRQSAL